MLDDTCDVPASVNRFAWERLLKASDAEPTTKLVGLVLATYANRDGTNAYPGVKRLMADCSASDKTVRRHLVKLRERGLVHRVYHASHGGVSGYADRYVLTEPPVTSDHHRSPEGEAAVTGDLPPTMTIPMQDHHSSRLALAHDKSRADEADEDDLAESIQERLEAWSLTNHGVHLDMADERYIVGMVSAGVERRVIENTIKKRIREAEEDWRAFMPGGLPEASGAPF